MMRLNFERTSPVNNTYLGNEINRRIRPSWYLDQKTISGVTLDTGLGFFLARKCRISRTFKVPSKSYQRIFQCARAWNFTIGAHAILEMDSNVD